MKSPLITAALPYDVVAVGQSLIATFLSGKRG